MNIKQAKMLIEGCGLDFDDGSYCSKEDELCPSCRREIDRMKSDAEYFLEEITDKLKKLRSLNAMFNCECGIYTDKYVNIVELYFVPITKKLKKIIEVLEG